MAPMDELNTRKGEKIILALLIRLEHVPENYTQLAWYLFITSRKTLLMVIDTISQFSKVVD